MGATESSIALTPEQIADLNKRLSHMRHDVNNHLSLIVAACELIRRKPELAGRMIENIVQQPEKICAEIRSFSDTIELILGIKRNSPPPVS
jgi:hypothetical protein